MTGMAENLFIKPLKMPKMQKRLKNALNRVFPGVEKVQPPVFELNRADFAPLAGRGMDRPRRALKILRTVENVRRPVDADQDSIERVLDRKNGKIDELPNRNRVVFFGISV